mmetsp:Transcript_4747/g.15670  ORF Transcript_4747/g.15670 Transcript_4747/m.15670 type:complete len:201 (-) Transcript_4747:1135-1737(-)
MPPRPLTALPLSTRTRSDRSRAARGLSARGRGDFPRSLMLEGRCHGDLLGRSGMRATGTCPRMTAAMRVCGGLGSAGVGYRPRRTGTGGCNCVEGARGVRGRCVKPTEQEAGVGGSGGYECNESTYTLKAHDIVLWQLDALCSNNPPLSFLGLLVHELLCVVPRTVQQAADGENPPHDRTHAGEEVQECAAPLVERDADR